MSKFDEILNSSDASDALLGEQIDALSTEISNIKDSKANKKDLKNFASITTAKLNATGWYRFFEYKSNSQSTARASYGYCPTFSIFRDYWDTSNEIHKIDLAAAYNAFKFINENSVSNTMILTKVRCVVTNTVSYIDLYYSSTQTNRVSASVMNADSIGGGEVNNFYWEAIEAPYKVDETASGETVTANYSFSSNKTIESRLAALEAKVGI